MILDHHQVGEILWAALKKKLLDGWINFLLPDNEYWAAPMADYEAIIEESTLDRMKFIGEKADCDDFALLLKAAFIRAAWKDGKRRRPYCFGEVWGQLPMSHAINWLIDDTETLYFVEPQSDEIFLPRADDTGIKLVKG
ncbi:hypothetical protein LCGC14_2087430 [marine sediment metagenome]|uniref:Agglutinin C-terminal domain-containing protein n=2 Tax=marine sediment metagenome TaxID=412755 RepID=A0A0F9EDY7_9ZZZZ|nr:hypothetical protein [Candidatus Aminicenantes bacterium]